MTINHYPFPHFIRNQFLSKELFDKLQKAVEIIDWIKNINPDFVEEVGTNQSVEYLSQQIDYKEVFSYFFSQSLINELQSSFDLSIKNCSDLVFRKITKGGFNVLHNDANDFGAVARLVLYMSEPNAYEGGELVTYYAYDINCVSEVHKFMSNTAFAFKISDESYHSVNKVICGSRVCLIATYS